MQKAEKTLVIFIILGLAMKSLHLAGAGPVFIMSTGSLSILYFLSAIANNPKFLASANGKLHAWLGKDPLTPNLVFGYAFSIGVIGFLFTVLLYPGNETMINTSLIGIAVALIYSLIKYRSDFVDKMRPYFIRILVISSAVVFFALLPKEVIIDYYYSDYPEYATALKKLQQDPHNAALLDSMQIERARMEELIEKDME